MTQTPTISLVNPVPGDSPVSVEIPQRLGPVELVREIGRGGMGVVWLGRDQFLQRDVAVKFLLSAIRSDQDSEFTLFRQGARAVADVLHEGLTAVYSADIVSGVPYLVMEYVGGPSLAGILKHGPLTPHSSAWIIHRICDAVGTLHSHELVHRDIKPSNILLEHGEIPKLTDFGLTLERNSFRDSHHVAHAGGTPFYMSPEMWRGEASPQSDIYALGITTLELLADPRLLQAQFVSHGASWSNGAVELLEVIPEEVREIIRRAIQADPRLRQKSAWHLAQDLCAAVGVEDDHARGRSELSVRIRTMKPGGSDEFMRKAESAWPLLSELADKKRSGASSLPKPTPVPLRAVGRTVVAHVPCRECGYDLVGAQFNGECPECATAVAPSLDRQRMIFQDPARLATGCSEIRIAEVAFLVQVCGGSVLTYQVLNQVPMSTIPILVTIVGTAGKAMALLHARFRIHQDAMKPQTTVEWFIVLVISIAFIGWKVLRRYGSLPMNRAMPFLLLSLLVLDLIFVAASIDQIRRTAEIVRDPRREEHFTFLAGPLLRTVGAIVVLLLVPAVVAWALGAWLIMCQIGMMPVYGLLFFALENLRRKLRRAAAMHVERVGATSHRVADEFD